MKGREQILITIGEIVIVVISLSERIFSLHKPFVGVVSVSGALAQLVFLPDFVSVIIVSEGLILAVGIDRQARSAEWHRSHDASISCTLEAH
jgi:hypothetical protein